MFAQTVTSVLAGNPTADTAQLQITPSSGPPSGFTNTRFEVVLLNGNPNDSGQLLSTNAACKWTSAAPVVCTLTNLISGISQQFQARVRSDETYGTLSSASPAITTLLAGTATGAVTGNNGSVITMQMLASLLPAPSAGSNPRIEVFPANSNVALTPVDPLPCPWSSTTSVTCSFVATPGLPNTFNARLTTDTNHSPLGSSFSSCASNSTRAFRLVFLTLQSDSMMLAFAFVWI